MTTQDVQLILSILTVLGSGISVYVGVRIALAEVKNDLKWHEEQIREMKKDIERLESNIYRKPS